MAIKIGDKVKIPYPNEVVKNYAKGLSEMKWISDNNVKAMKAFCELSKDKKYKVVDYCRSCKFVYIAIGKNRLQIREEYVKPVKK